MSPVSPVFHTEATVSIGLKNVFRAGTSIKNPTTYSFGIELISIIPLVGSPEVNPLAV